VGAGLALGTYRTANSLSQPNSRRPELSPGVTKLF
jgi:hypothetical protein